MAKFFTWHNIIMYICTIICYKCKPADKMLHVEHIAHSVVPKAWDIRQSNLICYIYTIILSVLNPCYL